jgi:DNA repair ATPase RecN
MLTELRIENFAIIQRLELNLKPGLITFTGETGAGKSIILDAITAVVGGKVDGSMIRAGRGPRQRGSYLQTVSANRGPIIEILEREDLLDDADYLLLSRELRREGRSTARVNGRGQHQPGARDCRLPDRYSRAVRAPLAAQRAPAHSPARPLRLGRRARWRLSQSV